jgi:hypothetical protein
MILRSQSKRMMHVKEEMKEKEKEKEEMKEMDEVITLLKIKIDESFECRNDPLKHMKSNVDLFTFVHENINNLCRYKNHIKYEKIIEILYQKSLEIRFDLIHNDEDLVFKHFYISMPVDYKLNRSILRKLVNDYLLSYITYHNSLY